MARKALDAGFTGDVTEETGMVAKARRAADHIRDETGMVAAHAIDHPAASGSALAVIGLAGFMVGYLVGFSSASRRASWR